MNWCSGHLKQMYFHTIVVVAADSKSLAPSLIASLMLVNESVVTFKGTKSTA